MSLFMKCAGCKPPNHGTCSSSRFGVCTSGNVPDKASPRMVDMLEIWTIVASTKRLLPSFMFLTDENEILQTTTVFG